MAMPTLNCCSQADCFCIPPSSTTYIWNTVKVEKINNEQEPINPIYPFPKILFRVIHQ